MVVVKSATSPGIPKKDMRAMNDKVSRHLNITNFGAF